MNAGPHILLSASTIVVPTSLTRIIEGLGSGIFRLGKGVFYGSPTYLSEEQCNPRILFLPSFVYLVCPQLTLHPMPYGR